MAPGSLKLPPCKRRLFLKHHKGMESTWLGMPAWAVQTHVDKPCLEDWDGGSWDRCRVAGPGKCREESRLRPRREAKGRWREARETRGYQNPPALPRPCQRRAAEEPAHPPACCFPEWTPRRPGARPAGAAAASPTSWGTRRRTSVAPCAASTLLRPVVAPRTWP